MPVFVDFKNKVQDGGLLKITFRNRLRKRFLLILSTKNFPKRKRVVYEKKRSKILNLEKIPIRFLSLNHDLLCF
jgi:hypothetical protein